MARRDRRPTLKRRQGTREDSTVISHGPFKGPSVSAWRPWANSVFVAGRTTVDGSPDRDLASNKYISANEGYTTESIKGVTERVLHETYRFHWVCMWYIVRGQEVKMINMM